MSLRSFVLLAVTAALVLTGCGSAADKNEYVKSVNEATVALTKALGSVGNVGSGEPAAVAATLTDGGKAIDKAAKDFEAITPPDNAKHAHTQMVAGLKSLANTFDEAAAAAKAKDTQKMVEILGSIQTSDGAKQIQAAQTELQKNGYKFAS